MHRTIRTAGDLEGLPWLEVIDPTIVLGQVRHAVFDFDGTISVIRRGWEDVMIPLMVEMICDGHSAPAGLHDEVVDYVDRSTGILTIKQMQWLAEAVRCYGLASQPRTAQDYKRIYNERLLQPVRARMAHLDGSDVARSALTIAGAPLFLGALQELGVVLYLASGTDHEYVVEEATALGVAGCFDGRIYGARDGSEAYSKDQIIKGILEDHDLQGSELLVVGDGPVEIRRAGDRGAIALGVAADEERRQGLNRRKRARLLAGGASLIITDFRHYEQLAHILANPTGP